jgi:tetratricopeptide (TPR) repeat protein
MPTRWRGTLSLGILGFALSACATIPAGPPKEAREAVPKEARAIPTIEASLLEALRKNEGEAKRFEQDGRLRESLERWKIVLTIEPQHAEARQKEKELQAKIQEQTRRRIAAGREQLQQRRKEAAQKEFLAALRLDPFNREALEQLYLSEEQLGEQTAFAKPVGKGGTQAKAQPGADAKTKPMPEEEAEEAEESGEEVSFAEAAELFRQGDYLAAIDAFTRVLSKQPGLREAVEYQKQAYYNQGMAYMKGENYGEALRLFEKLKKLQPDFKRLPSNMQTAREKLADQHYLAGIRHFKEQKLQEAIEEWDQALALNPKLESAKRSQDRARKLLRNLEEIK